jgi:peptidoglycan-associated lipoprotein
MKSLRSGILIFAAAALLSACSNSLEDEAGLGVDPTGGAGAGAGGAGSIEESSIEYFNVQVGDRVFFGTDSSELDSAAIQTLTRQARWLNDYSTANIVVEGHADERGTRDYNLALGARRATAARNFLLSQGVPAERVRVVSYGKERPVALCSDESCWGQNRRAVTVVAGGPTS